MRLDCRGMSCPLPFIELEKAWPQVAVLCCINSGEKLSTSAMETSLEPSAQRMLSAARWPSLSSSSRAVRPVPMSSCRRRTRALCAMPLSSHLGENSQRCAARAGSAAFRPRRMSSR